MLFHVFTRLMNFKYLLMCIALTCLLLTCVNILLYFQTSSRFRIGEISMGNNTNNDIKQVFNKDSHDFNTNQHTDSMEIHYRSAVLFDSSSDTITQRNVFKNLQDMIPDALNIYFLETRCGIDRLAKNHSSSEGFLLNARQCCSVESAALTNPDHNIYIMYTCPLSATFLDFSSKYAVRLFLYQNVFVVTLNITDVFEDSPVQELGRSGKLELSSHPVEHVSDVLSMLLLWKLGGTYSDLDAVFMRSLNGLANNYVGVQDKIDLATGIVHFSRDEFAQRVLKKYLLHINKKFRPYSWSGNCNRVITRILLKECNVSQVAMLTKPCSNFIAYPARVFYPVHYSGYQKLFDSDIGPRLAEKFKSSSYAVHMWNHMSKNSIIQVGATQAYGLLAEEFCPETYTNCGSIF